MKKINELKFKKLSNDEIEKIIGGWKLFGKESTPIAGSHCIGSNGCHQDYVVKKYFFGFKTGQVTISGGCSVRSLENCSKCTNVC